VPKNRAWCGSACERSITTNHVWDAARAAVIRRDNGRCVACGEDDYGAKAKAYQVRCGKTFLEVNHIQPVNGQRRNVSCTNHQENLETLCHDCHVVVTKQQRAAGSLVPKNRHIWKVLFVMGVRLVQCAKCGATAQAVHINPNAKQGQTLFIRDRYHEDCTGLTLKAKKALRRRSRKR